MKYFAPTVAGCRSCVSLLLAGVLLSWVPANAAQEASKPSHALSAEQKDTMATLILNGRSLLEAGNTGDTDLILPLRSYLTSRSADSFNKRQAVMALAKLGDQRAQQQIVCAFYGDDKIAMQDAAERDLPYVGGWFAIRLYRYLLQYQKIPVSSLSKTFCQLREREFNPGVEFAKSLFFGVDWGGGRRCRSLKRISLTW
jgi:hypothetical protein